MIRPPVRSIPRIPRQIGDFAQIRLCAVDRRSEPRALPARRSRWRPQRGLTTPAPMSYVPRTVFDNDESRSRATTLAETAESARGLAGCGPEGDH